MRVTHRKHVLRKKIYQIISIRSFLVSLLAFGIGILFASGSSYEIDNIPFDLKVSGSDVSARPIIAIHSVECENKNDLPTITNGEFRGANLNRMNFSGFVILNSEFSNSRLYRANFEASDIMYSSFIDSNMTNANFSDAKLYGSDLTAAKLNNVNFRATNLASTDFTDANLSGSDLTDANLSNARLERSIGLTRTQLSKALVGKFTSLPPHLKNSHHELIILSRNRLKALKQNLSTKDLERLTNEFDFIDE